MDVTTSLPHLVPAVVGAPDPDLTLGPWLFAAVILLPVAATVLFLVCLLFVRSRHRVHFAVGVFGAVVVGVALVGVWELNRRDLDQVEVVQERGEAGTVSGAALGELVRSGLVDLVPVALAVAITAGWSAAAVFLVWRVAHRR